MKLKIELLNYDSHAFPMLGANDVVKLPESMGGELVIVVETGFATMKVRYITGPFQGEQRSVVVNRADIFDLFTLEWVEETANV